MKTRTEFSSLRVIWIAFLLFAATALWTDSMPRRGVGSQIQKVSLEAHIEAVTGPNAVDCGRHDPIAIANDEDWMMKSLQCAEDAAAASKPFRVIRAQQGFDSQIAHGLLGKADGRILRFSHDSAPCGPRVARSASMFGHVCRQR